MDQDASIALSGILAIALGCLAIWAALTPDANAVTKALDGMRRSFTFPKGSVSSRTSGLIGGLVGILIGLIALAEALDIIDLPRR
jgi:tetrahydromethanopterin S-methyltransferase subunit G